MQDKKTIIIVGSPLQMGKSLSLLNALNNMVVCDEWSPYPPVPLPVPGPKRDKSAHAKIVCGECGSGRTLRRTIMGYLCVDCFKKGVNKSDIR